MKVPLFSLSVLIVGSLAAVVAMASPVEPPQSVRVQAATADERPDFGEGEGPGLGTVICNTRNPAAPAERRARRGAESGRGQQRGASDSEACGLAGRA